MDEAAPEAARGNADREAATMTDAELAKLSGLGGITLEMLRETFDAWTIGETKGRLVAFRSGAFAAEGPESLKRGCVMADTVQALADQLCVQEWLDGLSADELETAWREGTAAVRP